MMTVKIQRLIGWFILKQYFSSPQIILRVYFQILYHNKFIHHKESLHLKLKDVLNPAIHSLVF